MGELGFVMWDFGVVFCCSRGFVGDRWRDCFGEVVVVASFRVTFFVEVFLDFVVSEAVGDVGRVLGFLFFVGRGWRRCLGVSVLFLDVFFFGDRGLLFWGLVLRRVFVVCW